jgi:triphosphoribosyl-dephospho-CoA synthase
LTALHPTHARPAPEGIAERLGRLALRSLHQEVALHPKPGLVSPVDNGSHADMSMQTFYRSLFALRGYFPAIARAGRNGADFRALQGLGIEAERAMLRATGGINTHRGAIFNLGLLCAAAGHSGPASAELLCADVVRRWGDDILLSAHQASADSHGLRVARRYGAGGARAQAAAGFPDVIHGSLPAYRHALAVTGDARRAGVQALFVLMERLEDSNLLWRGGPAGLRFARRSAADFLRGGGALAEDWLARAERIHAAFVARRLSPGGAADLLAVTLFLHTLEAELG